MSLARDVYERFFTVRDEAEEGRARERRWAESVLEVIELPYWQELRGRLDAAIDGPTRIGNHVEMVAGAARQNTLKEIRQALADDVARARRALAPER